MAQTITPVVHGGRRGRWARTLGLHVLGASLSAAVLGAVLGGLGLMLGAPWGAIGALGVAGVAALYALREAAGIRIPLPELRRQVPEWWRSAFSPGTAAFLYGLGLGVGFATHLRHGTLVAVGAAAVASGDPLAAGAVVAAFGLARSVAVIVTWAAPDRERAGVLTAGLERLALKRAPRILNAGALTAVAAAAVAVAGSVPGGRPTPVAATVLAVAFGWAAAAKTLGFRPWRAALAGYGLPPALERVSAVAVPSAESAVCALILAGSVALGAGLAVLLLLGFSTAVVRARRSLGDRLPCGCFGGARSRGAELMLARNAGLIVLAAIALGSVGVGPSLPQLEPADAFPAGLAAVGAGLAAWVLTRAARTFGGGRGTETAG